MSIRIPGDTADGLVDGPCVGLGVTLTWLRGCVPGNRYQFARHEQRELPALVDNHLSSVISLENRLGSFEASHCGVIGVRHLPHDLSL